MAKDVSQLWAPRAVICVISVSSTMVWFITLLIPKPPKTLLDIDWPILVLVVSLKIWLKIKPLFVGAPVDVLFNQYIPASNQTVARGVVVPLDLLMVFVPLSDPFDVNKLFKLLFNYETT